MCEHKAADNRDLLGLLDTAAELLRAAGRLPLGGAVADVGLTQAVQKLEAIGRICAGQKSTLIGEITGREAHRGQAAGSTADLLTRTLHLTRGEARGHTELAAGLALVPETAAALRDGRLSVEQARVTVRKAEEVKGRDDAQALLAAIDDAASTAGQTLDRQRLARTLDEVVHAQAPDVLGDRARLAQQRRGVWFGERGGVPSLEARLPIDGMAAVRAVLDALGKPDGAKDPRTVAQRHADALVALAGRYLDEGKLPDVAAQRPHVLLITTRCSGLRRNRPAALQGTRLRAGRVGTLSSPCAAPVAAPTPAGTRPRAAGPDASGVRRASRPRVLAIRRQAGRTTSGRHPGLHARAGPRPRSGFARRHATLLELPCQHPPLRLAGHPRRHRPLPRRTATRRPARTSGTTAP